MVGVECLFLYLLCDFFERVPVSVFRHWDETWVPQIHLSDLEMDGDRTLQSGLPLREELLIGKDSQTRGSPGHDPRTPSSPTPMSVRGVYAGESLG